jgi:uncharacterized protein (TIGR03643 family)
MKAPVKAEQNVFLDERLADRVIRAAWEDQVSFESIFMQFGLREPEVIRIMKKVMKPKMFIVWRERVQGRARKHYKKMLFTKNVASTYGEND